MINWSTGRTPQALINHRRPITLSSMKAHFILYVRNQAAARDFYSKVLMLQPSLDVSGMTEFRLSDDAVLGLMPDDGAGRLLGEPERFSAPPARPSAELYLIVEAAGSFHDRAIAAGARQISPLQNRDWGHKVAYSEDPDGHILAFAEAPTG